MFSSGFSPKEVKRSTGGTLVSGSGTESLLGISTDSRTIRAGELYIPLRGKRYDGHEFIGEAFAKGAAGALVEDWPLPFAVSGTVWKVSNTVTALMSLARLHRDRFGLDVVAITGSSGKTTTKTMLVHLIGHRRKVLFTPGTQNNLIGVPKALLRLNRLHQTAVLELGTNRWGEIRRLTRLSRPSIGVITNIGSAHLETFKNLKGVLRAKGELWDGMDPETGKLVLNADDPLLWEAGRQLSYPVVWYGTHPKANIRAGEVALHRWGTSCRINDRYDLQLPIGGRHNLHNALAALACAQLLGVSLPDALERFWDVPKLPGRLQMRSVGETVFVDDTYNANPDSLKAALDLLHWLPCEGKKVLVMGDMLELGKQSQALHEQAGRWAVERGVNRLLTVGPLAKQLLASAWEAGLPLQAGQSFDSAQEAGRALFEQLGPKDIVLLKGSRSMQMEKIFECCITSSTP
jgi:UDP-N-acetylmuramoyl-tripeptide--D-alanyl-D-alanine ligase